jgi:hypothetical protein
MDIGTTVPQNVGSPWSVPQAIDYVTPGDETKTCSIIPNPAGLQATIETTLVGNLLAIRFLFQNINSTGTVENLVFSCYFNFHPNGSLHTGASGPSGPGDTAGAPAQYLGLLSAGQSVEFKFYKGLADPVTAPEPASWALMAAALQNRVTK